MGQNPCGNFRREAKDLGPYPQIPLIYHVCFPLKWPKMGGVIGLSHCKTLPFGECQILTHLSPRQKELTDEQKQEC